MAEADPTRDEQREHVEGELTPDIVFEALPQKMKESIKALRRRSEPINILVAGLAGAGKSTLINALLGDIVAKAQRGPKSVTAKMADYEGAFMGVWIRVYDTVGFNDSEGRSDCSIVKEIASGIRFDLILICVKMDGRADQSVQRMFTLLSSTMPTEAWKKSVVVLTRANIFLQLENVPPTTPEEEKKEVIRAIDDFKKCISEAVSNKEAFSNVPFCIAGAMHKRGLPTTNDWLYDLWRTCLQRCSDEVRPLLVAYSVYAILIGAAAAIIGGSGALFGAGAGAAIGAIAGSIVPGAGTALGAALGASIGAGVTGIVGGIAGIVAATEDLFKNPSKEKKKK